VVDQGGEQIVSSGGRAEQTTVSGTQTLIDATASGTVVAAGGEQVVFSSVVSASVLMGGFQAISAGNAIGTDIDGGTQSLRGGQTISTLVGSGGMETISSGTKSAVASDTVVSGGGLSLAGGTAISATAVAGGVIGVTHQGVASATEVASGGVLDVGFSTTFGGGHGGSALATTIAGAGVEVLSGGPTATASGTEIGGQVGTSGTLLIDDHGSGSNETVASGGIAVVYSGGVLSGGSVASGATVVLDSGGVLSGANVQSGALIISSGVLVLSGQVALSAVDGAGGSAFVPDGAVAYLLDGAPATVLGLQAGGTLDLTFLQYRSSEKVTLGANDVLTVSSGSTTVMLQLSGDYSSGRFETENVSSGTGVVFVASGGAATGRVMAAEIGSVGSAGWLAAGVFGPAYNLSAGHAAEPMPVAGGTAWALQPDWAVDIALPHLL